MRVLLVDDTKTLTTLIKIYLMGWSILFHEAQDGVQALKTARVVKPDLIIYLQASTPVIMERIRSRNLPYEKPIDPEYIDALNEAYNSYFFHFSEAPLLVVKTDEINFVANEKHLTELVEQIKKPQTQIRYYAPTGDLGGRIG